VIAVEATLEPVYATLGTQRARLIGIALVTAIVGPLLSLLFLRRWLDRPVHDLIEGIRRVSEGRLDAVVPPADGELGRVAVAFNRMQARVAASQKQVVQSEKMASLGKLAAGVAHEINNPLTGVLAYTEDLIDDTPEGDPRREEYRVIQRETLRCREIVRHLLDFARHGETRRMPTSINDVLRRTVELVAHLPSFRDVRIVEDLQEGLPRIEGDPGQLQQVFLNFLVNAAEAMPHGGEAKIVTRLRRDAPGIVASVTDSGAGIPEEMLDRIFEPFFSTKGGKSNGLGLSVSWGIIEQHGGQIEVQSQRDKGTTFKVYLPA
jgi:two-component system NtrC family sensor kinase